MRARVTSLHTNPNMIDGGVQLLQEELVPKLKRQKGFRGFLGLTNTKGKAVTISLWETEADMTAYRVRRMVPGPGGKGSASAQRRARVGALRGPH